MNKITFLSFCLCVFFVDSSTDIVTGGIVCAGKAPVRYSGKLGAKYCTLYFTQMIRGTLTNSLMMREDDLNPCLCGWLAMAEEGDTAEGAQKTRPYIVWVMPEQPD